jgi:hypothetical protein
MAVTIHMPDGTVKILGKQARTPARSRNAAGPSAGQRKSSPPSDGARVLKQTLDRLDQVERRVNQREATTKKPTGGR